MCVYLPINGPDMSKLGPMSINVRGSDIVTLSSPQNSKAGFEPNVLPKTIYSLEEICAKISLAMSGAH